VITGKCDISTVAMIHVAARASGAAAVWPRVTRYGRPHVLTYAYQSATYLFRSWKKKEDNDVLAGDLRLTRFDTHKMFS